VHVLPDWTEEIHPLGAPRRKYVHPPLSDTLRELRRVALAALFYCVDFGLSVGASVIR
jgi:hypothetical protein